MAKGDGRRQSWLFVISLVSTLAFRSGLVQTSAPMLAPACVSAESRLLVEAATAQGGSGSGLVSVDPATGVRIPILVDEPRRTVALDARGLVLVQDAAERWALITATESAALPVPDLAVTGLMLGRSLANEPPRWVAQRHSTPDGTSFRIIDRSRHTVVLETSFRRRIELAASASSADGRFFVHVQANNVASDVFIFDALTLDRRTSSIPHDARLAAFAMSLTFSPDASCLAISMEREGDPEPDTWIVDLTATSSTAERVELEYVLGWVPTSQ